VGKSDLRVMRSYETYIHVVNTKLNVPPEPSGQARDRVVNCKAVLLLAICLAFSEDTAEMVDT
jgi:hypothetical protein